MSLYKTNGVLAVVPAYNEEEGLAEALRSLLAQTVRPDRIMVVVNNSTDRTLTIARSFASDGVSVMNLPDNPHLKAGALNAGIDSYLNDFGRLPSDVSYVLTMDGDTVLDPNFIANCLSVMNAGTRIGGVSAACLGKRGLGESFGQRTLALFQEVEYARHHSGRFRRNVHTMSGAGSFYRARAIQQILDDRGQLFREDASNLVEDYETTLELKEHGYQVTSNYHCVAHTDLMLTVPSLLRQRTRWVRGTVDELRRRGWRPATRQGITAIGIGTIGTLLMALWVAYGVHRSLTAGTHLQWQWLAWGLIWPVYQAWTVRRLGPLAVLLELLIVPELLFGVLRQWWLYRSIFLSYTSSVQKWA